ncbi:TlyA family RNA methyltransferase [Borreliella garinii]|uniref:Ribosomal RNA large subunit methyltransferase J n=1 Tax=Borreliella garinii PBr TaxID=498743 RepID=B7XRQ2_BORGR|nr:TlyA family RNA methyltransferase [Borreliella garinii]EED29254.1 ribosomal RNA large subunit methyltransferase J [Borreliella garinii PBr]
MKGFRNNLLNILCKRYPKKTREELMILILTGNIYVNSHKEKNPKVLINKTSKIDLVENACQTFVSRGGYKLLEALKDFKIEVKNKICVDVGSSTGGFTDCLLQCGANFVYSVDVGTNQLSYKLRIDPRVKVLERTNIFDVTEFKIVPNFAVVDVSFRSSISICVNLIDKLSDNFIIVLIKPQFEVKSLNLDIKNFNGVVNGDYLKTILQSVIEKFYKNKLQVKNILKLKTKGKKGNQEFMFLVVRSSVLNIVSSMQLLNNIEF